MEGAKPSRQQCVMKRKMGGHRSRYLFKPDHVVRRRNPHDRISQTTGANDLRCFVSSDDRRQLNVLCENTNS
jgi:hypothetical protein